MTSSPTPVTPARDQRGPNTCCSASRKERAEVRCDDGDVEVVEIEAKLRSRLRRGLGSQR